jgi:hypothetical protein
MLLTEPSYKPNTVTALSLAGEESKPEDITKCSTSDDAPPPVGAHTFSRDSGPRQRDARLVLTDELCEPVDSHVHRRRLGTPQRN